MCVLELPTVICGARVVFGRGGAGCAGWVGMGKVAVAQWVAGCW